MMDRLRVVLSASLLLNIFLAGSIGGGLLMLSRGDGLRPAVRAVRPIRAAGEGLPAADRLRFRRTMRMTIESNRALLRDATAARTEAAGLFVEPQFDQAAVAAALDRSRNDQTEFQARLDAAALAFAAGLPLDERLMLASGLGRGGPLRHPVARTP